MVTYHNTSQIFGFQYIPLEEMDDALFGRKDVGAVVFDACVRMMETINTEITKIFPAQVDRVSPRSYISLSDFGY